MRRGAPLLFVMIVGSTTALGGGDGGSTQVTRLILPDTSGAVPEVLRLALQVADADSVESGRIDIVFDSTVVRPRPASILEGPFGDSIDAEWLANTRADTLKIAFASSSATGYVGSGTWVTVEWELVGAGTTVLHFALIELERDEGGTPIVLPANAQDGSAAVTPQAVEPSTWGRVKRRFGPEP